MKKGEKRARLARAENEANLAVVRMGACPKCGSVLVQNKFGLGDAHYDCAQHGKTSAERGGGPDYRNPALPACDWRGVVLKSEWDMANDEQRETMLAQWSAP